MVLVHLVDEHLLQHVVGEADDLQGLGVAQVQGRDLAVRYPFLGGLRGFALEDLEAFLNDLLRIFCRSHLNKYSIDQSNHSTSISCWLSSYLESYLVNFCRYSTLNLCLNLRLRY